MQMNPIAYFVFETLVVLSESEWTARREAETVRSSRELRMKGVNFWEFRR